MKHQARLNSNTISHASQMIETLTWVARNEMITYKNSLEQVNTYFIELIKVPSIKSIQMVDANSGEVLLDANKKDEGEMITDEFILEAKSPAS